MKKYLMIAILMLGTWGAQAQEAPKKHSQKTPSERAEKITKRMTKTLKLTDEQVVKVKVINLEHLTKMDSLKKLDLDKDQKIEKKKALETSYDASLAKVLNTEQMTQFREHKAKMKAKRKKKQKDNATSDED